MCNYEESPIYTPVRETRHTVSRELAALSLPSVKPASTIVMNSYSGEFACQTCNMTFTSRTDVEQHVESRKHRNKLFWNEFELADQDSSMTRMGDPSRGIPNEIECRGVCWFRCSLCNVKMWDIDTVVQHCEGRRHVNNREWPSQTSIITASGAPGCVDLMNLDDTPTPARSSGIGMRHKGALYGPSDAIDPKRSPTVSEDFTTRPHIFQYGCRPSSSLIQTNGSSDAPTRPKVRVTPRRVIPPPPNYCPHESWWPN